MAVKDNSIYSEKKIPEIIMLCMKNLNFMVIFFIAFFMYVSTKGVLNEGSAKEFLIGVSRIPGVAWKTPIFVCLGYLSLMLLMKTEKETGEGAFGAAICELIIAAWLMYITNFAYTGLVLLVFADFIKHIKGTRLTYLMLVITLVVYLLADYELLKEPLKLIPFSYYVSYYNTFVRGLLLGINSFCRNLNSFLFISYMIFILYGQVVKNRRMQIMNAELESLNNQLKEANLKLEENAEQIAQMTKIEERNRLAREIHDTLGHVLTGVVTGIDACNELIVIAPEVAKKQLENIANAARQGMTDVRRSVKALRPDVLEKLPFEDALTRMISEMVLSSGVKINYENTAELNDLSTDEEDVIYRIIQESITNSMRHGRAKEINISIKTEEGHIRINISDNGIGCKNIKKGFGLSHMKERLDMLGGSLDYDGSNGFSITAAIPVRLR